MRGRRTGLFFRGFFCRFGQLFFDPLNDNGPFCYPFDVGDVYLHGLFKILIWNMAIHIMEIEILFWVWFEIVWDEKKTHPRRPFYDPKGIEKFGSSRFDCSGLSEWLWSCPFEINFTIRNISIHRLFGIKNFSFLKPDFVVEFPIDYFKFDTFLEINFHVIDREK